MHRARVALVAALLAWPVSAGAAPRVWTWAAVAPEQSVFAEVTDAIADKLEKNAGGEVRFKRRFGGVAGDEGSTLDLLRQGRIEAWSGSLGSLVTMVPELRALEVPFRYPDLASAQAALRKLKRGQIPAIQAAFRKRGLVLVTMGVVGWRNLSSTERAIRSPADLKGLRARSQESLVHAAMWRALGAQPKAAPLNELSAHFDTERFQVLDVPVAFLYATSVVDRLKHCTLTRHMPQIALVVVGRAAFETLPRAARARFFDGLDDAVTRGEAAADRFEAEMTASMQKQGITVREPDEAERASFRKATAQVEREVAAQASPEEREIMRLIAAASRR